MKIHVLGQVETTPPSAKFGNWRLCSTYWITRHNVRADLNTGVLHSQGNVKVHSLNVRV